MLSRSFPLRVWLPSRGFSLLNPWKPFSASHALGLFPSKLFSTGEWKKKFPFSSFVLALFYQPFPAWYRRFDDFTLTDSRSPHLLPEGLAQVGAVALLGSSDLSGALSRKTVPKSFSLSGFSLSTFLPLTSQEVEFAGPQGFFDPSGSAFSFTGCRPVGPF